MRTFVVAHDEVCQCTMLYVMVDGETYRLEGECLRCGKCCPLKCVWLRRETVNGVPRTVCEIQSEKPWNCALYPRDPFEPLEKGCGYRWVKE